MFSVFFPWAFCRPLTEVFSRPESLCEVRVIKMDVGWLALPAVLLLAAAYVAGAFWVSRCNRRRRRRASWVGLYHGVFFLVFLGGSSLDCCCLDKIFSKIKKKIFSSSVHRVLPPPVPVRHARLRRRLLGGHGGVRRVRGGGGGALRAGPRGGRRTRGGRVEDVRRRWLCHQGGRCHPGQPGLR